MPNLDRIEIVRIDDDGNMATHAISRCVDVNRTRSTEFAESGGERNAQYVTFRVRWSKRISEIEFDMPRYRIVWRGVEFDVRGYDDYHYQHRTVDLTGVSYG